MYVALRIWNEYLKAREPRNREAACERFIGKMNGFTALFMGNPPLDFDEDSGKPKRLNISTHIYGSVPQEDTRLEPLVSGQQTKYGMCFCLFIPVSADYLLSEPPERLGTLFPEMQNLRESIPCQKPEI
mgnify:CR=1 FL=1